VYTFRMSVVASSEPLGAIGLRELRARLSHYVSDVKGGRAYTVTEHGQPVARLVPLAGRSAFEQLVAQGVITPARRRPSGAEPPVTGAGPVSDLVGEQRR
jgi:prevent-host-death family protein